MATGPVNLLNILRVPSVVEIVLASRPAWLWDAVEGRILFANAAGTAFFRETRLSALQQRRFDAAQPGFAAIVRSAATLPRDGTPRLALLRFFIGPRDVTVPCRCHLPDGRGWPNAVMVAAAAGARESLSPEAQAAVLFDDLDRPVVLHREGEEIYRNAAAGEAGARVEGVVFDLDWHGNRLRLCIGGDGEKAVETAAPPLHGGAAEAAPEAAGGDAETSDEAETARPEAAEALNDSLNKPRRFSFVLDADGRFVEVGPALAETVGQRSADLVGECWADIAQTLGLDPEGQVAAALRRREAWGDIVLHWPTDAGKTAKVHLSAQPRHADGQIFVGYRGFGDVMAVTPGDESDEAAGPAEGTQRQALNDQERTAFKVIGEALGARQPADTPEAAGLSDEPESSSDAPATVDPSEADEVRQGEAAAVIIAALDRLPLGVAVLRNQRILYANPTFLEIFDYSDVDDLEIAGGLATLFLGRRADGDAKAIAARRRDGAPITVASRLGCTTWIDGPAMFVTAQEVPPAPPENGADAQAKVSELSAILDTATDGVIVLSAEARVESANRSAEALLGRDSGDIEGRRFDELVAPESRGVVRDYLDGLASGGISSLINDGREIVARARGGDVALFLTIGRIGDGESPRYCAVMRDLTQWKAAEAELVAARMRAEKASAQKSDFLAKMSHEIRTPLNAIIGFAEVMLEERFGALPNERYREYLKDIRASGEHIMSLVNDLLDLSKVEAGRLELSFDELNLNDIVEQSVAIMQPQANCEQVIIRTSLARGLPPILADARSMRQVMLNVLSNAIKFTPPGGQAFVSTALGDDGEVTLRVRDTGIGMSESDIETALEPFRQLAVGTQARQRGTGLGLPLTRALVEANRAGFAIRSRLNEGTLVEISFPPTRILAQ